MGPIIDLDRSNLEFLSAPVKITPRPISTAVYPNPTFSSSVAISSQTLVQSDSDVSSIVTASVIWIITMGKGVLS